MIVRDGQLDSHQDRFKASDDQKYEGVDDVHQPYFFVIDCRQPLVDDVDWWLALSFQSLVDCFQYRSCGHTALLSSRGLVKLREICRDDVEIMIV